MKKALILALSLACLGCVSPVASVWKTVPQASLPYDKAWNITVNAVSQQFEIETIDAQSGYLKSAWKVTDSFLGDAMSRSRCVARVESREPFQVKVMVEQQINDGSSWVQKGNDSARETEILRELESRLRISK